MAVLEFKLPDIGEGVHEGEIVRWIVPVGATVKQDDPVVEVMTDKATVEIPAPAAGVVSKQAFAEGAVAKVGDVIFVITPAGAAPAAVQAPAKAAAPAAAPAPAPAPKKDSQPLNAAGAAPATGTLEFRLPDIGEGVHEGEIVRWIKKPGEAVRVDDPIVEVMTDKATVEIPSPGAGVIGKTLVAEGQIAKVGDVLFTIVGATTAAPASAAAHAPASAAHAPTIAMRADAPARAPAATAADLGTKVLAAPATRLLARELGVNLATVRGSAPNGRVRPEDVRAAASRPAAAAPVSVLASVAPPLTAPAAAALTPPPTQPGPAAVAPVVGTREVIRTPFRGIRRKTAEAMARSKRTAAHFSLIEEVDCTELVAVRERAKKSAERYAIKITFMPYIMKATALALQEFPQLNAELDETAQEIVVKKYVNLGIAVDTPNGLVVPVVRDAHLKGLLQLAADLSDVGNRARTGKLRPDDFKDSTFSITNAGNIGGMFATPIINFPEVAILGVHAMRKRPVCVGDVIVARDIMLLSISIDHRLVDGADGARFMMRVKALLEDPSLMLL
jgi:pyruvate dehydrogenase E2 component (dihydrolipoamide acetyltransferase)